MLDRERTLHDADDHAVVPACIDVSMGDIHRHQDSVSDFDSLMLGPHNNYPLAF